MFKKVYYEVRLYYDDDSTETIFESEDSKGKSKAFKIAREKAEQEQQEESRIDEVLLNKWKKEGYRDNIGVDWNDGWEIEKQLASRDGELKTMKEIVLGE